MFYNFDGRPLLGLILLNEEYFKQLRDQVRFKNFLK
jgi:hypothetical protein